jgi:hypothetical protein
MTSPFWGNCPGLCDGLGFCEQRQGGAGTKPFPNVLFFGLAGSLQNLDDQSEVRFSILARKGACEGSACDAVLEDFLDRELVGGDVVKPGDQHSAARGDGKVRHPKPSATEGQATVGPR